MQALNNFNSLINTFEKTLTAVESFIPKTAGVIKVAKSAAQTAKIATICATESFVLYNKSKYSMDHDITQTDEALLKSEDQHSYYEILAQKLSYLPLTIGDTLTQSVRCIMPQYKVYTVLEDPCGMRGIVLVPTVKGQGNPLLIFRGTDAKNMHNILDDFRKNPASVNFERQKLAIQKILEEVSVEYGAFDILGHSFGAAMAQKTTAEFPEYIARCISYNGLRCGKRTVALYNEKMGLYPAAMKKPEIWEYRHAKDIVSLLGGKSLPTEPGKHVTFGSIDDSISHIEAHSVLSLSKKIKKSIDTLPDDSYIKVADLAEQMRRKTGKVVAPIHDRLLSSGNFT